MKEFEEKMKQYQKEEIENEILRLNCELSEITHNLKHKATHFTEFYFLCSKFVNIQNTIFKLKKELNGDQEKKEDKK